MFFVICDTLGVVLRQMYGTRGSFVSRAAAFAVRLSFLHLKPYHANLNPASTKDGESDESDKDKV